MGRLRFVKGGYNGDKLALKHGQTIRTPCRNIETRAAFMVVSYERSSLVRLVLLPISSRAERTYFHALIAGACLLSGKMT